MPTFQFEAMDATGQEIKDVIEAPSEEEAQATIRQMGYFVTKIAVEEGPQEEAAEKAKAARRSAASPSAASTSKMLTTFTRQLSILQDAGLPILRSLRILEGQQKAGPAQEQLDGRLRRNRRRAPRSARPWPKAPRPSTGCT